MDKEKEKLLATSFQTLGLKPGAAKEQIEKAFRQLKELYAADSKAIYGLYEHAELEQLRQQIAESYHLLLKEYDQHKVAEKPAKKITKKVFQRQERLEIDFNSSEIDGQYLRDLRNKLELTLDDIWQQTKINKKQLMAIENNDLAHLPANVYLKGFLRLYGEALGIDGRQLAKSYMSGLAKN